MDKFIFRERKALTSSVCDNLIDLYEKSPNKRRNPRPSRNYTMLDLSLLDFSEVTKPLSNCMKTYLTKHKFLKDLYQSCILYTSPSTRDQRGNRKQSYA